MSNEARDSEPRAQWNFVRRAVLSAQKAIVHGLRRWSLRTQLAAFTVALIAIGAGGSAVAGWQIVTGLLEQGSRDRITIASATFASTYAQRVAEAELVARQLSERNLIAIALGRRDVAPLLAVIETIPPLRPNYTVMVVDDDGVVIARTPPQSSRASPERRILTVSGVADALDHATAVTSLTVVEPCTLTVTISAPIIDASGLTIGLVHVRFPLDEEFVRQVKADTGLESSLYCADRIVATTLPGGTGAPGARASAVVRRTVIQDGGTYEAALTLTGGRTFLARWTPLVDVQGQAVGMYAVGNPVQSILDARAQLLGIYLPIIAGVALLALLLGSFGSLALTAPLRGLAQSAARIGAGDFVTPIAVAPLRDEVGQLAARMEEMRESIASTYGRLRELNTLKDEYLFSVAHEVRTPMTSLVAITEVLDDDLAGMSAEDVRTNISRIARAVARLNMLVENVLDAGSIRAGRFTVRMEQLALADVLESSLATVGPLLTEKGQGVVIVSPKGSRVWPTASVGLGELPAVWGDVRRVGQVFVNLLSNAAKYGPIGDTITIRVSHLRTGAGQTAKLRIEVADNGPGVPLPDQADVFERHFRASSAVLSAPGTGLGLAISRAIVEAHGGTVGLESGPGKGTTVWFTLVTV